MVRLRKAEERGHFDMGWLNTYHTFSFSDYHDPAHMGFRSLRVINDDIIQPAQGFGTHGHRDMEIITYVLSGKLSHKDSEGNTGVIGPGEVQRMTAGTGIRHSEFNASEKEAVHLLQIWILPARKGVKPRYEDRTFPVEGRRNQLQLIASPDEANGSLSIDQDVRVYSAVLEAGKEITFEVGEGRGVWVQVARGALSLGHGFTKAKEGRVESGTAESDRDRAGEWAELAAGDGAAIEGEHRLVFRAESDSEMLIFDLS